MLIILRSYEVKFCNIGLGINNIFIPILAGIIKGYLLFNLRQYFQCFLKPSRFDRRVTTVGFSDNYLLESTILVANIRVPRPRPCRCV